MEIDSDLIDKRPIPLEAEELIQSDWADRTAYGIAGQNPNWHNYIPDLAQEARLVMWKAAESYRDEGGSIVAFCKQRGRWAIIGVVNGSHLFTGSERATPVSQKRGDESRARLQEAESYLRAELSRDATISELSTYLNISERTVSKQRAAIKNLPGIAKPSVRSLEELLEAAGNEGALGQSSDIEQLALAYHYNEIHTALVDLPNSWRMYVWLRFWEGWTEPELRREGIDVGWNTIRPVLAEKLAHLISAT